jgi:hypothetical protein
MSFVALRQDTRERVDITQYPSPKKEALKHYVLLCQECGGVLRIKEGYVRVAHFAHLPGAHCGAAGESQEHRNGKMYLRDHLTDIFPDYAEAVFDFEYRVPEGDRIIDLLVTLPDGRKIAHEVQLASITTKELQERTDDYAKAGISTVWWLGGNADTKTNVQWCLQQFEVAYILLYKDKMPVKIEIWRKPPPRVIPPLREEQEYEEKIKRVKSIKLPPPLESHFSVWDRSDRVPTGITKDFDVALWIQWLDFAEYTEIVTAEDGQEAIEILMRKYHVMYARHAAVKAVGGKDIERYRHVRLTSRRLGRSSD